MSKFKPSSWPSARIRPQATPARAVAAAESTAVAEPEVLSAEPAEDETSELTAGGQLTLNLALLFMFFRISFLHEFITSKIHVDLHLLLLLGGGSCLAALLSGRLLLALKTRIGRIWLAFAFFVTLATAFSTWRGGSLPIYMVYARTTFPMLLLIPAMVRSRGDLRKVVEALGWAGVATIFLGFSTKEYHDGRMVLVDAPSIGDSNDYAAQLLFVMPLVAFILLGPGRALWRKVLGTILIPAGLYQIVSTGSRGAVVASALMIAVIVVVSKPKVKLAILFGVPLIGLLAIPLVPTKSAERLASLFKSQEEDTTDATASGLARRRLLEQSIALTLTHPVLGVGPGEFMDMEGILAKASGERGMWHQTHNTYTQVSSECGIPAFLCYISAVGLTLIGLWKLGRRPDPVLAPIARVIFISTFGFAAATFFLSHAYDFPMLVSGALYIVLEGFFLRQPVVETSSAPIAPAPVPARLRFSPPRRLVGRPSHATRNLS